MFFFLSQARAALNEKPYNQTKHATGKKEIPTANGYLNFSFWKYSDFCDFKDSFRCATDPDGWCYVLSYFDIPWAKRSIALSSRYFKLFESNKLTKVLPPPLYHNCSGESFLNSNASKVSTVTDEQIKFSRCKNMFRTLGMKACLVDPGILNDPISDFDRLTQISRNMFPECETVLKDFPCLAFHPNMKYMTTVVKQTRTENNNNFIYIDHSNVRICKSYADKVYDKCRYAKSISDSSLKVQYKDSWTVEPKMGLDDFYKKLQIYWFNQSDPEEMDRPGINCWDPTNITNITNITNCT